MFCTECVAAKNDERHVCPSAVAIHHRSCIQLEISGKEFATEVEVQCRSFQPQLTQRDRLALFTAAFQAAAAASRPSGLDLVRALRSCVYSGSYERDPIARAGDLLADHNIRAATTVTDVRVVHVHMVRRSDLVTKVEARHEGLVQGRLAKRERDAEVRAGIEKVMGMASIR